MSGGVAIGIPFIDKAKAISWAGVTAVLAHTLLSVFRQSSQSFEVAVACTDKPSGRFFENPRITFIHVPANDDAHLDVAGKIHSLLNWAARSNCEYYYGLDSDDLISNRLVRYVLSAPPATGFLIRDGYACDSRTRRLAALPAASLPNVTFDKWCGSAAIVRMEPGASFKSRFDRLYAIWKDGHWHARERIPLVTGKPAVEVPFRAALYRLNTGENTYFRQMRAQKKVHLSDWIFQESAFEPDGELREEFGI